MVDYRSPGLQAPQRKPLPSGNAGLQFHSSESPSPPLQKQISPHEKPLPPPMDHHRPRTASSSFLPNHPLRQMTPVYPPAPPQYNVAAPSRHPSNATTSTSSTGGNGQLPRHMNNLRVDVRRSSSSRTSNSPGGYVALMRKQKATVWCDRAQPEDPRLAAQRRAAKNRALREVHGGGGSARTSTLQSGKIRHSTVGKSSLNTGTMVGAGVPLRLSANEILGEDDDDDRDGSMLHRRTGSGRSSNGSNRVASGYQRPQQPRLSNGSGNTPPGSELTGPRPDIPQIVESPADEKKNGLEEFSSMTAPASSTPDTKERPSSSYSFTAELEDDFGMITEMSAPRGAAMAAQRQKVAEDLKRRGSVDDRTSSTGGVRLFVANPDLSD